MAAQSIFVTPLWIVILLIAMLISLEVGRSMGRRRLARSPDGASGGLGAIEGAVFGLFGLMIAFTFSGAAGRFDIRRQQIVEEANDIGTAYLRLDLLPPEQATQSKELFRQYLDLRLAAYAKLPDVSAAVDELTAAAALQGQIWRLALEGTVERPQARMLLLPALNSMFDIASTRTATAMYFHPPPVIYLMLAALAVMCSILAGHGMSASGTRSWLHMVGFAAIMSLTIYVIFDLEYPRFGWIRINQVDQILIDVRESMK